jgi:hypothetical protein
MIQIILIFILTGVIGILLIWRVYKIISKKLKKETVDLKSNLIFVSLLVLILGGLILFNIYLISSKIIENKDQILGYGQKAISSTVDYGATAVFEGLGSTIDHFDTKWDASYSVQLKKVDIKIKSLTRKSINETSDSLKVNVLFNNRNIDGEKLNLSHISDKNYLLVGGKDSIYYPIKIRNNQYNNYLPLGKTVLMVEGIVPKDLDIKYIRLLNTVKEIK